MREGTRAQRAVRLREVWAGLRRRRRSLGGEDDVRDRVSRWEGSLDGLTGRCRTGRVGPWLAGVCWSWVVGLSRG